jgi:predicted acetyltransferase
MKKILELNKDEYLGEIKPLHASRFNEPEGFRKFFFENCFKNVRVFGVLEDGKLISMAFAQSKKLVFNDRVFDCQLLSYICTDEKKTRQGNAFNLIERIKEIFKAERCDALYLCPEEPNVYKSSGFVPFCFEREIVLKYSDITVWETKPIPNTPLMFARFGSDTSAISRKAEPQDAALLLKLYNEFMKGKNGFALRDEAFFNVFVQSQDIDLIYKDGICRGYIAFDGYYFEVCADIEVLEKVKSFDGRTISISTAIKGGKKQDENVSQVYVSQMIAPLNSSLEPQIFVNPRNINFDRYW